MNTDVTVVAETPGGKQLGYRVIPDTSLYEICMVPGGALPQQLKGRFTRIRDMIAVINAWVESDEAKKRASANASKTAKRKEKEETS